MVAKRRTDQGGSVASAVIIGAILVIVLIGGIYFVKQRSEQASRDKAIAAYDKQQADKKAAETAKSDEKSVNSTEVAVTPTQPTVTAENLPHTGPESTIFDSIGVFLLTSTTIGYISSKRAVRYL